MAVHTVLTLLMLAGAALALAAAVPAPHGVTSHDAAHQATGIDALHRAGLTGAGVRVAVLDTGLDETHPALDGLHIADRRAFLHPEATTDDGDGHGTLVTGILAAQGTPLTDRIRGLHLRGVAPDVDLYVHKVLHDEAEPPNPTIAAVHVRHAVDANVDLICLSLGFGNHTATPAPGYTPRLTEEIQNAVDRGVLVVAAAGNTDDPTHHEDVQYPANLPGVIAVAAVDPDGHAAPFTRPGNQSMNQPPQGAEPGRAPLDWKPEIAAPGVGILGPTPGGYTRMDGTSAAVPFVCGGLALLLEAHPELRARDDAALVYDVKRHLTRTAHPVAPHGGQDAATGYGLFRADRLTAALST